ncbi:MULTISPECIES: hypothetical protein [unclassified Halorubrum]|uniref:hypothetical protein n=1 Tax=unclassified Halorubrum TaxID=2642239 RepID=UPI000B990D99|nr:MULTISPECIES: hypothetical protein [unclassified Halorubrum]OYR38602.1 hypothetical protein DJ81_17305 [Halorubrum sp. Hd13]OYR41603.1 hypothetical protein DJ75_13635 [Halorubrum sp. Eb13]OYR44414.1 hypothetical protein DJ74_17695 [Halorubrum sp. Ea8]OYR52227.1 hypothetical protein DJ73_11310 [Halorubrum sp. Ea1]
MARDAADGPRTAGDSTGDAGNGAADADGAPGTGSPIVDRWVALDRGWQALALGLGIVAAHVAGQAAGVF